MKLALNRAQQTARIAELEEALDDIADEFAALCREFNTWIPLAFLPFALQLQFEELVERLGATRSWPLAK
jgi:hypothetical protein